VGKEATANVPGAVSRPRVMSDRVSSTLSTKLPKYSPPPKSTGPEVDLRDVDKPRNEIIRLPKYVVEEKKSPVFRGHELLTPAGRLDLALKRHPGLRFGPLAFLNHGWALAMLAEEERLDRISEMKDVARTVSVNDPADAAEIKRLTDLTFMRTSGFGYKSGPGERQ